MRQSLEILSVFNFSTLKQIFWITQTLFIKLEYCFLVESTKIENATFPYNTVTTIFFRQFCFSLRTSYKKLIWCTNNPNVHIHAFRNVRILFEGRFGLRSFLKAHLVWASYYIFSVRNYNKNPKLTNIFSEFDNVLLN